MNTRQIAIVLGIIGLLATCITTRASSYTWDNTTTPPAGNGAGPWDTTTAHWYNGTSDVLWPNSLSDTAVFGLGGAIGNDQSLVTVDAGGVQVGNITFNYTDTFLYNRYTLQTGPITLADGGTIKQISSGYADSAAVISSIIHGGAVNIGDGINSGAVRFNGANDYTGVTTVKAGAGLLASNNSALGLASAGTEVLSGGSLCLMSSGITIASEPLTLNGAGVGGIGALYTAPNNNGSTSIYNGPITLGSDARINSGGLSYSLNIGGPITGAFNLTLGGINGMVFSSINTTGSVTFDGTGASAFVRLLTANTFTGGLIFKGNNADAYVRVDNVTSLGPADKATVTFGPGATGYIGFYLLGSTVVIVGLNTDPTDPGTPVIKNHHTDDTLRTLTVNNAIDNTFAGSLQNGSNGKLSLIKGAAGTLTLSGANSYTGTTTINGGTLVAGHANALVTSVAITVNNSGTLLGVAAGVTLTRVVTFGAGSGLAIYFTDVGAGKLAAVTPLSLTGKKLVLRGTIKPGSYVVASNTSGTFDTPVDVSGLTGGSATVTYPGDGTVVVTAAPPVPSGTVFKIL